MDPDRHLLKKIMRCPSAPTCDGKQHMFSETNIPTEFHVEQISALQFYQAVMGIGLPKERKCGPSEVRKILVGSRVLDVHLDVAPDDKRSIIYSITLENGNVLHLAASTRGATVFRVTEVTRGR
jgi:hypothetical protein